MNLFSLAKGGLETWLLPLKLPDPPENCEDLIDWHREMLNDYYIDALKYFQLALHSTPPLLAALLPLVQVCKHLFIYIYFLQLNLDSLMRYCTRIELLSPWSYIYYYSTLCPAHTSHLCNYLTLLCLYFMHTELSLSKKTPLLLIKNKIKILLQQSFLTYIDYETLQLFW